MLVKSSWGQFWPEEILNFETEVGAVCELSWRMLRS